MREIKFRGRTPSGKWVYGYYVGKDTIIPFENVNFDLGFIDTSPCYEVIPDSIGQFTGLHDKKGKEIYEGDIIRGNCGHGEVRHLISFYDMTASFVAEILPDTDINDYCTASQIWILKYSKEVIGNIHDNPELLNK